MRSLENVWVNRLDATQLLGAIKRRGPKQLHWQWIHLTALRIQDLANTRSRSIRGDQERSRTARAILEMSSDGIRR